MTEAAGRCANARNNDLILGLYALPRRCVRSLTGFAVAVALALVGPVTDVRAAPAVGDYFVSVGAVMVAEPGRISPFPIVVGPQGAVPADASVRVVGLSPFCELIGGKALAQGAWSVPVANLARVRIRVPQVDPVRTSVRFALVNASGAVLAEVTRSFVIAKAEQIAPADDAGAAAPAVSGTEAPAALGAINPPSPAEVPDNAGQPPVKPFPDEVEARLRSHVARGDGLMSAGDIASARLFYKRAAAKGYAPAALALARSYDPSVLLRQGVVGFTGDADEARRWYDKARELGAR